jgi:hypothetical protein
MEDDTIGIVLSREIARVRDEIMPAYGVNAPEVPVIQRDLSAARTALAENDIIAMAKAHGALKLHRKPIP